MLEVGVVSSALPLFILASLVRSKLSVLTMSRARSMSNNEDAFSSSSSDDEGDDSRYSDDDDPSEEEESFDENEGSHSHSDDYYEDEDGEGIEISNYASEFDKAVKGGRESKGAVSKSFFADDSPYAPPPPPPPQPESSSSSSNNNHQGNQQSNARSESSYNRNSTTQNVASASGLPPRSSSGGKRSTTAAPMHHHPMAQNTAAAGSAEDDLASGVLPDVLMTMRQKIEALTLFDSAMMKLADDPDDQDPELREARENLKRSSQQSISAAVLVSLAHKRYERRRMAAMEIEKVVRSLVQQEELDRVRAILLLLSDDYVRSTLEDARKGGVVALAAAAIGLKKASDTNEIAHECRDLILASVVHACQDHSQRVRYYATEVSMRCSLSVCELSTRQTVLTLVLSLNLNSHCSTWSKLYPVWLYSTSLFYLKFSVPCMPTLTWM